MGQPWEGGLPDLYAVLVAEPVDVSDTEVTEAIGLVLKDHDVAISPRPDQTIAFIRLDALGKRWSELDAIMHHLATKQFSNRLFWLMSPPLTATDVWRGWMTQPEKWDRINATTHASARKRTARVEAPAAATPLRSVKNSG